jgi:hypothetical protein
METDPKVLEEHAYNFLSQEKYDDAYRSFTKAAAIFKHQKNHKQAALCFASAASAWSIKSGEKAFSNAASSYEEAAQEAQNSGDFEYASLMYKYAAINFERDMEFISFSDCFYRSKECQRRFLNRLFTKHKKMRGRQLCQCLALNLSFLLWGHGERPIRTFVAGLAVIVGSAFFYAASDLLKNGVLYKPTAFDALYFSAVTFTTVGYGDLTPVAYGKIVVIFESLCGLLVVPLFMIGLSRRYLRA